MAKDKTQILLENKAVFEETLNEFSSKTYELASVNEIIKRSQFNKGSFYYRFKDKFELYISLLDYVFVQQIDLFNLTGFSLVTHHQHDEIILSMYNNLVDLYQIDQRYFYLLMRLLNENSDFINQSFDASVGSLYQRYIKKLNQDQFVSKEQLILIQLLYKNFPILDIQNNKLSIHDLISTIINQKTHFTEEKRIENHHFAFIEDLDEPISYLLMEDIHLKQSQNYYNLLMKSQDINHISRRLKFKTLQFKLDLRKILLKMKHKPIFNHIAIDHLLNNAYDKVKDDQTLYPILLTLVGCIIDMESIILIPNLIQFLDDEQRELLFNYILPINGRLSRIVLIDRHLYFIGYSHLNSFYYYDQFMGLKQYHISEFKRLYHQKFYCEYMIEDKYHHEYFDQLDDFIKFNMNNQIKVIKLELINEMSVEKIREEVSQ